MTSEPARGSGVVLLVEDDAGLREIVRDALVADGHTVLVARDGGEALEIFDREAGSIDLVITDVLMPGMGGPELVGRLSASYPTVKVLYISGYGDDKTASTRGLRGPVLPKPFSLDALARKVRELLERPEG